MAHDVLLFSLSGSRASCARELDLGASFPPRSSSSRASPSGRTSPRRRKRTRAAEATAAGKQTNDENEDRTRTPRHIRTQTSLLSFCVQPGGRAIFWFVCCDGYISRRPGGRSLAVYVLGRSRALAGSFARAGGFALGARKLHPARVTIKRTSRAAADEPARQKRRRSGGEAVHARRSFERRRRWSSLHSEFFLKVSCFTKSSRRFAPPDLSLIHI